MESPGEVTMNPTKILLQETLNYERQSTLLPEKIGTDDTWAVFRREGSERKLVSTFAEPRNNIATLYENLEDSIARFPERPYLGSRKKLADGNHGEYEFTTYRQFGAMRTEFGSGLRALGVSEGATLGLYASNSFEWALVDAGSCAYGMITVPLYDTLGPDAAEYVINHAECEAVATSALLLPKVLEFLPKTPSVKLVVVFGTSTPDARLPPPPPGSPQGVKILAIDRVRAEGLRSPRPHSPSGPNDPAIINYTSGTTGTPKGVIVTHANLISAAAAAVGTLGRALTVDGPLWEAELVHLSYLPLAHIYERLMLTLLTYSGGSVGFFRGDVLLLLDDLAALQPTIFPSVPRLWNRIHDKVLAEIDAKGAIARKLFAKGAASKTEAFRRGDFTGGKWAKFWDRLVFGKVQAKLGGKLNLLVSGSAPISKEVFEFLQVVSGALVIEGYGMTETASIISTMLPGDPITGHVGPPLSCNEVKLVAVPEMSYTPADLPFPRGEICVRGHNVFPGYYKDPEATREAIDEDGWFHTGDIGTFIQGGRLKIIDRKKNIFKLSQGEYIAPEKVEAIYLRSPFALQVFVYGDSFQSQLVAIVVPDPDHAAAWAKARGIQGTSIQELASNPKLAAATLKSLQEEGRISGLKGFEQAAAIKLIAEEFTPESGLLTPTMKLKRNVAKDRFQPEIDALYAKLGGKA